MKSFALILTREHNDYTKKLYEELDIDSVVISDSDYQDSDMMSLGFYDMTRMVKRPSAWDKAFYYLAVYDIVHKYDYFYFIEDDVYCKDLNRFNELISFLDTKFGSDLITYEILSKEKSEDWMWWGYAKRFLADYFTNHNKSFNPLCRLSSKLIEEILYFRVDKNQFFFHEVLFPTLCADRGLIFDDFRDLPEIEKFIGTIQYRPLMDSETITDDRIHHPVKPPYISKFKIHDA